MDDTDHLTDPIDDQIDTATPSTADGATTVAVDDIDDEMLAPSLRERSDQETVARYAELYESGHELPPITCYEVDGYLVLVDGWHRLHAQEELDREDVEVIVHQGTRAEALLAAIAANQAHGLPLRSADRRNMARALLGDEELRSLADREIARRCGMSPTTVGKLRAEMGATSDMRLSSDGREVPASVGANAAATRAAAQATVATTAQSDSQGEELTTTDTPVSAELATADAAAIATAAIDLLMDADPLATHELAQRLSVRLASECRALPDDWAEQLAGTDSPVTRAGDRWMLTGNQPLAGDIDDTPPTPAGDEATATAPADQSPGTPTSPLYRRYLLDQAAPHVAAIELLSLHAAHIVILTLQLSAEDIDLAGALLDSEGGCARAIRQAATSALQTLMVEATAYDERVLIRHMPDLAPHIAGLDWPAILADADLRFGAPAEEGGAA